MSGGNPIGRFFGAIWRLIERLVKGVQVLIFVVFIAIILSALSSLSGGGIVIPEKAALVLAPGGILVEQPEGEPLDRALVEMDDGPSQTVVHRVVKSLEYAAADERIHSVVLLPGYLEGGGLSKHVVIADALDRFRESGKPVIAMADSYNQSQYFLAAHADEIYMHDFGFVLIEGFGYFKAYFADALDKLQVDVNVFRVGEFKSFVEPYLRNDMSDEDKQASERWLEALWGAWKQRVVEARGVDEDVLDNYVNDVVGVLVAADGDAGVAAVDAGLVDGLLSYQEFRRYMIDQVGVSSEQSDTFEQIDYLSYLLAAEAQLEAPEESQSKIAVLVASGEIVDGEGPPGVIGSSTLTRLIRQVAEDEDVAAMVLRIDSPGGSMFASEVIFDQLEEFSLSGRPIIASMSSTAASGGYYIAMGADEIWAEETTISGSIGVGAMFPTFQRSLESLGVTIDGFGTTALTGQLSPVRELGDEARDLLDISVKSAYDVFIGKVAAARSLEVERVDEIAQGRVWVGEDAYKIGLIDSLGGVDAAVVAAAAQAGLPEGSYEIEYVSRQMSLAEKILLQYARLLGLLLGMSDFAGNSSFTMNVLLDTLRSEFNALNRWNDPRGIYYHCMCELR